MRALSRRHLLRGAGAAIALPLLDVMQSRAAESVPPRLMIVYAPSGKYMPYWTPSQTGTDFTFPRTLASLEKHRENVYSY